MNDRPTPAEAPERKPVSATGLAATLCDTVTIDLPGAGVAVTICRDRGATGEEFAEIVGRVVSSVFGED